MTDNAAPAQQKPPSVDRLSLLWRRINEHKIVQWSVAYVALAYAIQHAVTLTSEAFEWPHAIERTSMLLLVLGLPLVMTLAWYHGARASRRISGAELSILATLLVGVSILFYVFVQPSAQTAAGVATRNALASPDGGISLAVLPFVNLSSDKEQEFFSDGITEEITTALAQVKGLRVVGRTSAFAFKGQNKDLRTIAQALGATDIIEGSVRKAGNRLRITAQLVRADNDSHLWAENYDRELNDVFAIQEEIAQAIAASLQVPLGLKKGETLVTNRAVDSEGYENYLRAKALVRARGKGPLSEAASLLETVVAHNPNYAPAWALLSEAYLLVTEYEPIAFGGSAADLRKAAAAVMPKAEAAGQKAIELDPKLPDGYAALGAIDDAIGKLTLADDMFNRALALDPNNPDTLHFYAIMLAESGHEKKALAMRLRLRQLEALVPVFNWNTASVLLMTGQTDAALAMNQQMPPDTPAFGRAGFALIYAVAGRYREAADMLESIPADQVDPEVSKAAARLMRTAPAKIASSAALPPIGQFGWIYLFVGAPERMLEYYERNVEAGFNFGLSGQSLWGPFSVPVRTTERFKMLVRRAGYVDYWRAKGWPDLCHPTTGDDFVCE
jgi:TolB-like protein